QYAGTRFAIRAADLFLHLESPLDVLDRKQLPAGEQAPGQPPELVAVLGAQRRRHWGAVFCVAVSPDSKWIVSGGQDSAIRVWEAATMRQRSLLAGHKAGVNALAFTPDGKTLASAGSDYTLKLWDFDP